MEKKVRERSNGKCEMCGANGELKVMQIEPWRGIGADEFLALCSTCHNQVIGNEELNPNHWRCLGESMWSDVPSVKALSYRMLHRIENEAWVNDLIDQFYADDETLNWAKSGVRDANTPIHRDSNGVELQSGDTVVLIKDLDVKGAGFTAKRGTAVRNIRIVQDNHEQIEGKVNGQSIVILTQYVKK